MQDESRTNSLRMNLDVDEERFGKDGGYRAKILVEGLARICQSPSVLAEVCRALIQEGLIEGSDDLLPPPAEDDEEEAELLKGTSGLCNENFADVGEEELGGEAGEDPSQHTGCATYSLNCSLLRVNDAKMSTCMLADIMTRPYSPYLPVILQMEVFNSSAVKNVGRLNCEFLRHEKLGQVGLQVCTVMERPAAASSERSLGARSKLGHFSSSVFPSTRTNLCFSPTHSS